MLENFIYAKEKSLFEEALNNGEVLDEAIVFIEDTKEIWNHGTYFDGSTFDPTDIELSILNILDTKLDTISDLETIRSGAALGNTAVQPAAISDMETKTNAANTYQVKGDYALKSDLESSIPTKVSELENDVPYVVDDVMPENGVYAVKVDGSLVSVDEADESCIAVALIQEEHQFMIEKNETNNIISIKAAYEADRATNTNYTYFYWGMYNSDNTSITNYTQTDGGSTSSYGYLPQANGSYASSSKNLSGDYTTWTSGALSDFNGKANTAALLAASDTDSYTTYANIATWCRIFNQTATENQGYTDWYIPACGQLSLMYLNMTAINAALTKIGGQTISSDTYWSSSECSSGYGWCVNFTNGYVNYSNKSYNNRVRFVRDFTPTQPLKERVKELENTKVEEAPNDGNAYTRKNNKWVPLLKEALVPIDLSKQDIYGNVTKQNTANCYVVKKAGIYKFPCVYGNAIKDGVTNATAYLNNGGSNSHDFINYKGTQITSPYIATDTGETITSAQLSIADTDGIFSNVTINEDYVAFIVDSVPDTGANGVISIKDSTGTIMWNWHIWVWKDDLTPVTITNNTGVDYNILPVNLASKWVSSSSSPTLITNWYYQWGRPTPLTPASTYNSTTNATTYGTLSFTIANAASNFQQGITAPTTFYKYNSSSYNWFSSSSYYNLWDQACTDTGCSDNNVVKTVYDPCPPGFKMPNGNTFTGFGSGSTVNVVGSFTNGYKFKRNSSDTTGVFFPASGYRYYSSGSLYVVGSNGYVWSAAAYSQDGACSLSFSDGYVNLQNYNYRAYGFSVRPVAE